MCIGAITARVNAAVRAQDCTPICVRFWAASVLPNLRAVVQAQPIQPTAKIHENRGVFIWEECHDVPNSTLRRVRPQLLTIGGVYPDSPLSWCSHRARRCSLSNSSNNHAVVNLHHIALLSCGLCLLSAPESGSRPKVQRVHDRSVHFHAEERVAHERGHHKLGDVGPVPKELTVRSVLEDALHGRDYDVPVLVDEGPPNEG
mmetsp:Transcript_149314/g.362654  ORF Transcript_149314/g.362654 Transcript_149314/m.362654 type:complete len:202 (-) Transcript_149314:334-939(-)